MVECGRLDRPLNVPEFLFIMVDVLLGLCSLFIIYPPVDGMKPTTSGHDDIV